MTDMKKKLLGIAALALMASSALMVGCTKEDGNVFRLKIQQYGNAGKTTLGEGGVTQWVSGDQLYVNGASETDIVNVQVTGENYTAHVESSPINGKYYFFYPGNCTVTGFDGTNKSFTYTMPNRITYNANALNAPMAGASNGQDVNFANICTMLKLEFFKIPTSITITSESTAISGAGFTARYNGSSWSVTAPAATDDNKTITITNSNYMPYVYVPLPAGNHKLTITATNVDTKEMSSSVEMVKNTIYPIHFAHPFSVSDTKKVYFSPGNLYYDNGGINATKDKFYFSNKQWDRETSFPVVGGTGNSAQASGNIYLFRYGTSTYSNSNSASPKYPLLNTLPTTGNLSTDDYDWGYNPIVRGGNKAKIWRTPTTDEWNYLFNGRGSDNLLWARARVNNINGIIVFPDGIGTSCGIINTNNRYAAASTKSIAENDWVTYENKGCVFLPCGSIVSNVVSSNRLAISESFVRFWSATPYSATSMHALSISVTQATAPTSYVGVQTVSTLCRVRLVRDAN